MFSRHEFKDSNKLSSSVITFGNFDGLHLGHQEIFKKVLEISNKHSLPSVVLSFSPHTNDVIFPAIKHFILTTIQDKINIIKEYNFDIFCQINFTENFSNYTPDEFLNKIISKYNPQYIILGYDNKFGKNGLGDIHYIKNADQYSNIEVLKVDPYKYKNNIVKTSLIKDYISNGNVSYANLLMTRKYCIIGKVISGNKIGTKLGFPTANIKINESKQIIPKNGVYSVNLIFDSMKYESVCNIGLTPTLNLQDKIKIEVHVINKDIQLYNKEVIIEFKNFIRDEIKFKSKTDLINQIKIDIDLIRKEGELKC